MADHEEKKPMSAALQAARAAQAARIAAGETIHVRNPLEKLTDKPTSLRTAITAKCYQCEGEDADAGVKKRIGQCGITTCALWAVRPYQQHA
jgi:hypothetical protein